MAYVAKPEEFDTLELAISGIDREYYLNRYGETFPPEYPTLAAVGNYVLNGGIFIDYCGYPFYHWNLGNFDKFLASIGADPNYWIGFMPSELPYPIQGNPNEDPFVGYPFPRGWISTMWLGDPNSVIVASFQAPSNVKYNVDYYGTRVNLYVYSVVGVRGGQGWYFYGFGQQDGPSVDPLVYGMFIRLIAGQVISPPGPIPCNPDACMGTPLLQYGSENDCVGWVQRRLNELGYSTGPVDCVFGSQTRSAVMRFQSDYGLVVDGIVGPQTWNALRGVGPAPTPPPAPAPTPTPTPAPGAGEVPPPVPILSILVIAGAGLLAGGGLFLMVKGLSTPKGAYTRGH